MARMKSLSCLPIDRNLDRLVEVPNAEADAVETEPRSTSSMDNSIPRGSTPMLILLRQLKCVSQHGHQATSLGFALIGGCAATPVQLGDQLS